jgi:hypothetical protein
LSKLGFSTGIHAGIFRQQLEGACTEGMLGSRKAMHLAGSHTAHPTVRQDGVGLDIGRFRSVSLLHPSMLCFHHHGVYKNQPRTTARRRSLYVPSNACTFGRPSEARLREDAGTRPDMFRAAPHSGHGLRQPVDPVTRVGICC